jgi:hypothetical protein
MPQFPKSVIITGCPPVQVTVVGWGKVLTSVENCATSTPLAFLKERICGVVTGSFELNVPSSV